jgi:hypothetical protein
LTTETEYTLSGRLAFEIEPINECAASVIAFVGGISVRFSAAKFLPWSGEGYKKLSVAMPEEIGQNDVMSAYLQD